VQTRTYRKIQALVLGATGLFLLQKIWSGSLYFYINERFLVLILLAALGFLVLAQVLIADLFPQKKGSVEDEGSPAFSDEIDLHQVEEHLHAHVHTHDGKHVHTPKRFPWILLVVALPVLLGILIPARPLGASAVANKGLRVASPLRADQANNRLLLEVPPNNRTILDWQQIVGSEPEPTRLIGEPVDVVGFVYRDPRLPDGQFMVGRFTLTCCVADAFAIGMVVDSPESANYPENTWVRVQGTLDLTEIDGQEIPSIQAGKIQEVSEPAQPYLIP
jgi:putative membrane protein